MVNPLTVIISPEWSSNNCNSSKDCDNASGFDSLTRYKHESIGDLSIKMNHEEDCQFIFVNRNKNRVFFTLNKTHLLIVRYFSSSLINAFVPP